MSYSLDVDPRARDQIATLPPSALPALADAFALLELVPWNSPSANPGNPDGAVRMAAFGGPGVISYLILEDRQRVDILTVVWAG